MPKSTRRKSNSNAGMQPTSQKLERIDSHLQKMLDYFPAKGELSPGEIQDWHRDLGDFSLEAIDFAFESHRRNAIFFPLPAQIIDLCISYDPPDPVVNTSRCDAICKARHGKGYHWNDMYWLFEKMKQAYAKGDVPDVDALMKELDSKRVGGAPEWRRVA